MPKATGEPLSSPLLLLFITPNTETLIFQNSPSLNEAYRQNLSHRRRSHRFFQRRRNGEAPWETPRQGDRNRRGQQTRRLQQDEVQDQDPRGVSQGGEDDGEEEVPRSEAEAVGEMGG